MKVLFKKVEGYAEEGQPNPLKWMILHKGKDGLEQQSAWLICKDFFNDYLVAQQLGIKFNIYGFNTKTMNIEDKNNPVYMLLDKTIPDFANNIQLLNETLPEPVELTKNEQYFLLKIPNFYWKNTYYISLLSLMIRLMNYVKFNSKEDIYTYKQFPPKDQAKWDVVVKKNIFFKLPSKYTNTWYVNSTTNDEKCKDNQYIASYVHNNGVLSWSANL